MTFKRMLGEPVEVSLAASVKRGADQLGFTAGWWESLLTTVQGEGKESSHVFKGAKV